MEKDSETRVGREEVPAVLMKTCLYNRGRGTCNHVVISHVTIAVTLHPTLESNVNILRVDELRVLLHVNV
jgi:hypothetical protein